MVIYFFILVFIFGFSNTTPLDDDVRFMKSELEQLKSKTDILEFNYTSLEEENEKLKKELQQSQSQLNAQVQQKVQAVQQDLLFVNTKVGTLYNQSENRFTSLEKKDVSFNNEISNLNNRTHQEDLQAKNRLTNIETRMLTDESKTNSLENTLNGLQSRTSQEDLKAKNRLTNLETRISQEESKTGSLQHQYSTHQQQLKTLQTQLTAHEQEFYGVRNVLNGIKQIVSSTIAFRATITNKAYVSMGSVIKFPNVVMNRGSVYNSASGQFTCPKSGLYKFMVFLQEYEGFLHFMRNGNQLSSTIDSYGNSTSLSALLEINRGDKVWVVHRKKSWPPFYGKISMTGSFTGYLISLN